MPPDRASAVTPEFTLLGLLYLEPGHGYELHERLRRELGAVWTVRQNQVYNILSRLEADGYVRAAIDLKGKSRQRRKLRLTPAGRRRFEAWLHKPTGLSVRALRVDFLSRLYFARQMDPKCALEIVDLQLSATREGLEQMEARHEASPDQSPLEGMSMDLRLRQLHLAAEWLEGLSAQTRALSRPSRARQPLNGGVRPPRTHGASRSPKGEHHSTA